MKIVQVIVIFAASLFTMQSNGQESLSQNSSDEFEKATFVKGELGPKLLSETVYPEGALKAGIEGDVLLRVRINQVGKLDSIIIISTPDIALSKSAFEVVENLQNSWQPTRVNKLAIDKEYLVAFRFRIYKDGNPPEYQRDIDRFVKKNKFTKVLKFCNDAILDNPYNFKTYKVRAVSKEKLGDIAGSKEDLKTYHKLYQEILASVDIFSKGYTKYIKVATESTYH